MLNYQRVRDSSSKSLISMVMDGDGETFLVIFKSKVLVYQRVNPSEFGVVFTKSACPDTWIPFFITSEPPLNPP
jgi:hypothetical protein